MPTKLKPRKKKQVVELTREFAPDPNQLADLLMERFVVTPYYAQAASIHNEVSYSPVKRPLTPEIINAHLAGKIALGAYHLSADNLVNWVGWDIDSTDPEIARKYADKIIARIGKLPHAVEFSGHKGYHIFIFLDRPMPAGQAKVIVDHVRDTEGLPKSGKHHVECYPKQGELSKMKPMGSLIKLPLGEHPRTHNRSGFIDPTNGWEVGEFLDPIYILNQTISPSQLNLLARNNTDYFQALKDLLVPQWIASPGEHHNLALHLSGYLANLGWAQSQVEELIEYVASSANDKEVDNRVEAVRDTYKNIAAGQAVRGFAGLNELIPGATLATLTDLATKVTTPALVKRVDGIRLAKGAPFEKVRGVAQICWADLVEQGELVQTQDHEVFWYCREDHMMYSLAQVEWRAILHKKYGINPAESFGSQVTEAIRLRAVSDAKVVTIHRKCYWDGNSLFINLGGSVVWRLTGEDVETTFNGDHGILFRTFDTSTQAISPDFTRPVNLWKYTTDDLSFHTSENAPATPEEQAELLKAWMLASFFQELMPTKPLLLAMGMPGSGKTTAMRRLVRILEDPNAEVLEVIQDKPDSLRTSVTNHAMVVLDNLEKSGARWLVDTLNRLATGASMELRTLYQTNQITVLRPRCFVAMTAVSMPFSDETLFSRILPLELQTLSKPLPEHKLQQDIRDNLPGLWADILLKLNMVVGAIRRDKTSVSPINTRLADFSVFCKKIEKSGVVNGATLMRGLRSLVDRQRMALLDASPFVVVLEDWLGAPTSKPEEWHTFTELFQELEPLARAKKFIWRWTNPVALKRHVLAMEEPLKKLYGMKIQHSQSSKGRDDMVVSFEGG